MGDEMRANSSIINSIGKRIAVLAAAIPFLFSGVVWAGDSYSVVEVGALHPGGTSIGRHMDSAGGQVVGSSGVTHGSDTRAFIWNTSGMHDLGTLPGGNYSEAFGVNDAGTVVGDSNTKESMIAFVWTAKDGIRELSPLPGDVSSRAFAINNAGEIVGYSSGAKGVRAVIWSAKLEVSSLGTLPGGKYSEARAINDAGEVVGVSANSSGRHAFLWSRENGMIDLGVLRGTENCKAVAISNGGHVAGSCISGASSLPFVWTKESGMQSLGSLGGAPYAEALGVNDAGQVVGSSETPLGARAFVWSKSGGMQDLNSLISSSHDVLLAQALHINKNGQILVVGSVHHDASHDREAHMDDDIHAGPMHLFLLTPSKLSSGSNGE
jgi:probable HAF family extracellular repeat protein